MFWHPKEPQSLPPREKFKALHDLAEEALTAAHRDDSEGRPDRALRLYRTGLEAVREALGLAGVQGSGMCTGGRLHGVMSQHGTRLLSHGTHHDVFA